MTLIQQARAILRKAFKRHDGKRPGMARREQKALDDLKPAPVRKPAPKPYALTERDGHRIDQLTNYALYAMEKRLRYTPGSLTVLQGSYNAGGVAASAGTHDGGGAVDLTPANWEAKVHAARAVGFAAWHRTAIPGVWPEHVHMILIGNEKLSPMAADQVTDYRNHRNGLAGHAADNTWHPNPIPTFHMPKYAEESK
jgi:hypothetical protein